MSIELVIKQELSKYRQKDVFDSVRRQAIQRLVLSLALSMKLKDPTFDEAAFIKSCGVKR